MGDSRILIHVSRCLIPSITDPDGDSFVIITTKLAADSSVRELFEDAFVDDTRRCSLLSLLVEHEDAAVWDCTTSPPKIISDWPLTTYSDKAGRKSRTLYDAGWFPSARIVVTARGVDVMDALGSSDKYDDYQYNNLPSEANKGSNLGLRSRVQLVGPYLDDKTALLPSQVIQGAAKRFENEYRDAETDMIAAQKQRESNKLQNAVKMHERNRKIEDQINRLEERVHQGRNRNVSEQVQKMLIKSRATGRRELANQDRRYFRCLIVTDDDDASLSKEDYRYFSNQDSIGRILSTFSAPAGKTSELLVRVTNDQDPNSYNIEYCRVPVLVRVYEAIERDYFAEFDKIVIRMYDPQIDDPTTPIADMEPVRKEVHTDATWTGNGNGKVDDSNASTSEAVSNGDSPRMVFEALSKELATFDKSSRGRPASAASVKVKQMQMKSKAKGDVKRVKPDDRFFVELVTAIQNHHHMQVSLAPVFMARTDPLERLVTDCAIILSSCTEDYKFLVPDEDGSSFRIVADTRMRFCEAEQRGILKCFGRIILLYSPSNQ